ncbi:hypothetical protein GCM10028805_02920 [Spirosoma harenae]
MQSISIYPKTLAVKLWQSPTFNTWASLLARSLNLVILIPFILKRFSPAEISLWYLFSTIIGLNLMLDLGFNATFTRFIAYAMAGKKDKNQGGNNSISLPTDSHENYLSRIVGTQQVLFRWMTLFIFALLITIGTLSVLHPISLLKNPLNGWYAWVIVIVATTISFRGNVFSIYLQGINKITELRRYETFFSLAAILSSIIVLSLNPSLLSLIAVNQFWIVVSALRNKWLSFHYHENIFIKNAVFVFDREIFKETWPSAWRSAVGVLMSYGVIQSSSLIYAQSNQAEDVSSYLFAMRIVQIIITFSQAPFYSKLPLLARLYAQNDFNQIVSLARKGMMRAHWTFVIGFIGVALLMRPAMKIIGSNINFVDTNLWILIGLGFFIERYGAMHLQLYSISNKIIWHIANGVTGVIYICLAILLYKQIGVYAFPISILISYLCFYSWYTSYRSYKTFHLSFFNFELRTSIFPLIALIIASLVSVSINLKL